MEIREFHWLMNIVQNLDVGLVVLDKGYRVQVWNGFMESHSGRLAGEVRERLKLLRRRSVQLKRYLAPQRLAEAEIAVAVDAALATHGKTPAAMGKIMAELKAQLAGRADMAEVSRLVKSRMG